MCAVPLCYTEGGREGGRGLAIYVREQMSKVTGQEHVCVFVCQSIKLADALCLQLLSASLLLLENVSRIS